MWDCSKKLNRKHTNSDTVVGFENEMVSAVQCQCLHKTLIYPAEQYGVTHTTIKKSTQVLQSGAQSHAHARHARRSRVFTPGNVR